MFAEDTVPTDYAYAWSAASESDIVLSDFLERYKPSMVKNNGRTPWIWVRGGPRAREDAGKAGALKEAKALLKEVSARVKQIKNDDSIPLQPNKATGAMSKKQVREQVQAEAAEKFGEIATRHGWVSGKCMIFAEVNKVDSIWADLATSLVSRPLAATPAFLAKVATACADGSPTSGHLVCLYMPDVYDKPAVIEVLTVLARHHGLSPFGVKANMYGAIGIDSKHPSGVPPTVRVRTRSFLERGRTRSCSQTKSSRYVCSFVRPASAQPSVTGLKALKKEYNAELKAKKAAAPKVKAKPKPKPPKKPVEVKQPEITSKKRAREGSESGSEYESDGDDGDNSEDGDYDDPARKRMRTGAK
ncbi:hypothetical protein FB451DRAFT_1348032 [Mycena latifolia]|nr:hypothetical protein FB451DRAFT_1348032 [Mycena latifolia]